MSNDMNRTVREFYKAVEGVKTKKGGGYDTQATVRRIEDGVAWVHIPDGVDETPAKLTISAKVGDVVQVRVVNGRAFLVGNASAPPTDNTEAVKAMGQAGLAAEAANIARQKADEAVEDAATAHEAAMSAQDSADIAQAAAEAAQRDADDVAANLKSVVAGATTVEKAVSVMQTALEAVVDYDPTTDTTKEYFWHDANGAHVLGTDSGYRNDVDSSGMKIVEVSTEDTVAEFGASGAQIGKDDESHLNMDDDGLSLVDYAGTEFAHIGSPNTSQVTDTLYYLGVNNLELSCVPSGTVNVYVNGIQTSRFMYDSSDNIVYVSEDVLSVNDVVTVTYSTNDKMKYYTFGKRTGNSGNYSIAEGYNTEASGTYSHAEGNTSKALGIYSHAEGHETAAYGDSTHAEGVGTEAVGTAAHAQNYHTRASAYQTAIGMYNDNNPLNAFEIGNGDHSARSNAMTVDWSGNVAANDIKTNTFDSINSVLSNMIVIKSASGSATINGNTNAAILVTPPTVSGYTPIAIYNINNDHGANFPITDFGVTSGRVVVRNLTSTSTTVKITVTYVYIRTALFGGSV